MFFINKIYIFVIVNILIVNTSNEIDEKNKAIDVLKEYSGENPYLLELKNEIILKKHFEKLNDFNCDYILRNHNFQPKLINKIVKITDWYGEKLQKDFQCEFRPEKLQIKYLLGETENTYHVLLKYRQNMEYIYMFLSKKGVMTNFLISDYNLLDVDFDRYDRLSATYRPDKPRKIKEHQKAGIKFLLSRKKCILADDMGLAKTAQLSIASVEGNFDNVLIICPASLKTNWFDELSYYVPTREISIIGGVGDMKKNELEKYLGYGVGKSGKNIQELLQESKERGKWIDNRYVIINYDILSDVYEIPKSRKKADIIEAREHSPILKFIEGKKSLIIIDEAHKLSNMKSQQYKIISQLINIGKPDSVYLATGTPITNDPVNYFNILSLIENDITSDWKYYMERYCGAKSFPKDNIEKEKRDRISREFIFNKGKKNWYELTDDEKKELNNLINKSVKMKTIPMEPTHLDELMEVTKHIYLRRTKEDLGGLPSKYVYEKIYDLTDEQKIEYNKLWSEYVEQQKELDPNKEINKELLEGAIYRKYLSNQMVPYTINLAEKCIKRGEKVIIACCYDEELYTLKDYFGDKCVVYNGKMSLKQKDEAKNKFINNPECMVFIGNIDSCGVGINLTVSRVVIFNNFSFVPGINRQMEDRCYRLGQTRDCHIFYQFFRDTQYQKMWGTVLKKELNINQIIKKENEK